MPQEPGAKELQKLKLKKPHEPQKPQNQTLCRVKSTKNKTI